MSDQIAVLSVVTSLLTTGECVRIFILSEIYYTPAQSQFQEALPIWRSIFLMVISFVLITGSGKHFLDLEKLPAAEDILWSMTTAICGWFLYWMVTKLKYLNTQISQLEWQEQHANFNYSRMLELTEAYKLRGWTYFLILAYAVGIWGGLSALFRTLIFVP